MNLVVLSGNLAKDARLLSTAGGKSCCITTLAIREDMRPENKSATFIDIIIWGERAEKLYQYLTKGKAVAVTGRIEIIRNTRDNNTYVSPRVVVNTLEFIGKKSDGQEKISSEIESVDNTSSENEPETENLDQIDTEQKIDENIDDEVPF